MQHYPGTMLECDRQYNIWHVHLAYYEIRYDHCHLQSYQSGISIFLDFSLTRNKQTSINAFLKHFHCRCMINPEHCILAPVPLPYDRVIVIITIIMINDALMQVNITTIFTNIGPMWRQYLNPSFGHKCTFGFGWQFELDNLKLVLWQVVEVYEKLVCHH